MYLFSHWIEMRHKIIVIIPAISKKIGSIRIIEWMLLCSGRQRWRGRRYIIIVIWWWQLCNISTKMIIPKTSIFCDGRWLTNTRRFLKLWHLAIVISHTIMLAWCQAQIRYMTFKIMITIQVILMSTWMIIRRKINQAIQMPRWSEIPNRPPWSVSCVA